MPRPHSALVIAALVALVAVAGCGPSRAELRERTVSVLNTEAERWDGGPTFDTTATDAYGRPVTARVVKQTLNYELTVRSAGPDGLPNNSDDITAVRTKRHGESSIAGEAAKGAEKLAEGVAGGTVSGAIQGVKKGFGFSPKTPATKK